MKCNKKHGKNNYIKFSNSFLQYNRPAFSLIELSVVLIIIGLLVAGITGGASLIESAKNRAFLNELNGYKQAVHTFYVSHGRLPGDINRDYPGLIGWVQDGTPAFNYSTGPYKVGDFPDPYDKVAVNSLVGPLVELYLDGLIDFKPAVGTDFDAVAGYLPFSKIYKDLFLYFQSVNKSYTSIYGGHDENLIPNSVYIELTDYYPGYPGKFVKAFKFIDQKADDGVYNTGNVRAACIGPGSMTSYEGAVADNSGGYCLSLLYRVW